MTTAPTSSTHSKYKFQSDLTAAQLATLEGFVLPGAHDGPTVAQMRPIDAVGDPLTPTTKIKRRQPSASQPPSNADIAPDPPPDTQRPFDPYDEPCPPPPEQRPFDPEEEISRSFRGGHDVGSLSESPDTSVTSTTEDADKLLQGLSEGAVKYGKCELYPIGQYLRGTRTFRTVYVPCGSWECDRCGPILKRGWYIRLEGTVTSAPYLEATQVPMKDWGTFYKRVRRAGIKSHIKMEQGDGMYLVLVPGEVGGEVISRFSRKTFLYNAIKEVPFTRQPISTSRDGWVPITKREKNKKWLTLGSARQQTIEEHERILDEFRPDGVVSIRTTVDEDVGISGSSNTLEFTVPTKMMRDGTYWRVLWSLGILSRRKGEKRGVRRKKGGLPQDDTVKMKAVL